MKFGPVPLAEAKGAILAHSVALSKGRLRKGITLDADHIAQLDAAGVESVVVARLDPTDVHENEAADRIARSVVPDADAAHVTLSKPFTGRVNILAAKAGVAVLDVGKLEKLNRIDPMLTIATVPPYQQMQAGGMIATVKIISYGVEARLIDLAIQDAEDAISLAPPVFETAGLILTQDSFFEDDKGAAAVRARVEALGLMLEQVSVVPHDQAQLTRAIGDTAGDMLMILTETATSDINDTAPAALRAAGGHVHRFGMPVDPGNLLFVGALGDRPVIGLPGCARSPALNGADWVLSRIACGIEVTDAEISGMGVGGLLKEIPTRPQPRRG